LLVTPRRAATELHGGLLALVDVRAREEWRAGAVPGSRNIPLSEVAAALPRIRSQTARVAFICARGAGSRDAAKLAAGFGGLSVASVDGGLEGWARAGLPLEPGATAHEGGRPAARAFAA
jgi:hydroxyacylglutathione hydrolase